jgi:DNA modification methylase
LDNAAWYIWHAQLTQGYFSAAAAADVSIHRQIIWAKPTFNLTRSGMYHWSHEPCFYGWQKGKQPAWYGAKNQRSVWEIDKAGRGSFHPTQKPTEIFAIPMRNHLRKGEVCAEPFAGSGSQIVAAESEGVHCYAMEISEAYCEGIIRRYYDTFPHEVGRFRHENGNLQLLQIVENK